VASPATPAAPVSNGGPAAVRAGLVDAVGLCLLKAGIGAWVLASGFSHVSDDDYARTVIAEQFAHAPRLDPSGTSWLPFPFWIAGSAMMVFGRSLATARAIACVLGVVGVVAPYAAMRALRVPRVAAVTATAIAMALPWNAWLGVATVPDGWTGALVAAGAIAMAADDTACATLGADGWTALALLAASLSRYEAWPVCGLLVARSACRAIGGLRSAPSPARSLALRRDVVCALVAAAGPLLWMAWNAHAHGSPTHFVTRVTSFRRAIGAADLSLGDKLLGFPRALADDTPEVVALGLVGAVLLFGRPDLRRRWRWPGAAAGVVLAFLVAGDLGDGAPTHHPARALGSIWWILTGLGVDAVVTAARTLPSRLGRRSAAGIAAALAIAWCTALPARWRQSPGRGQWDDRDPQIARGLDMRARDVAAADVAPCSFEHFALLAAWGAPERARIAPRTGEPPTPECPRVSER
jgi:hypothetical protein